MIKKLAQLTVIALSFLFVTKPLWAQNLIQMSAIPPRIEDLSADPGEVVTRQIKVRNLGGEPMELEANLVDFIVQDNKGTPAFLTGEQLDNRWALSGWVNVSPRRFVLKPGETKELDLVIVVPEDAMPGGRYAAVVYQPAEGTIEGQESASKVIPSVASLIYLTINGDVNQEAFVSRMTIPHFSEFGPIPIETEIENLSDIHIKPVGEIKIYNLFGKLKTKLSMEDKNIFPGQSRSYQNQWDQKWLLGRYKATLEASYGSQGGSLNAIAYFWVIPWRLILVVVLVVVALLLLTVYLKRKKQPYTETDQSSLEGRDDHQPDNS
ncbi:MAG: hypothetical protein ABID04_00860 [Patescibacteria group bacterium]